MAFFHVFIEELFRGGRKDTLRRRVPSKNCSLLGKKHIETLLLPGYCTGKEIGNAVGVLVSTTRA